MADKMMNDGSFQGMDYAEQTELPETLDVNGKGYRILKFLGKGKGGYSFLAEDGMRRYVLKQIHHEPCAYYQFGNKLEAELTDYGRLSQIGIRMPELLDIDLVQERILKEYIDGPTIFECVRDDRMVQSYYDQIREMCVRLYANGTNIDYYPTNFVVQDGVLFYIDYECNDYMEEWNYENWGSRYWSKTLEFLEVCKEQAANDSSDTECGL